MLVAVVALAQAAPKSARNACQVDSECRAAQECCFKEVIGWSPYEVSSVGKCTAFLEEGANCFLWSLGGCGCGPGLQCVEIPTLPIFTLWPNTQFPNKTGKADQDRGFITLPEMRCKKAETI